MFRNSWTFRNYWTVPNCVSLTLVNNFWFRCRFSLRGLLSMSQKSQKRVENYFLQCGVYPRVKTKYCVNWYTWNSQFLVTTGSDELQLFFSREKRGPFSSNDSMERATHGFHHHVFHSNTELCWSARISYFRYQSFIIHPRLQQYS